MWNFCLESQGCHFFLPSFFFLPSPLALSACHFSANSSFSQLVSNKFCNIIFLLKIGCFLLYGSILLSSLEKIAGRLYMQLAAVWYWYWPSSWCISIILYDFNVSLHYKNIKKYKNQESRQNGRWCQYVLAFYAFFKKRFWQETSHHLIKKKKGCWTISSSCLPSLDKTLCQITNKCLLLCFSFHFCIQTWIAIDTAYFSAFKFWVIVFFTLNASSRIHAAAFFHLRVNYLKMTDNQMAERLLLDIRFHRSMQMLSLKDLAP